MTWAAIERGRRLTAASLAAATRDAAAPSPMPCTVLREVRRDCYADARRCATALLGPLPTDGDDIDRHSRAYVGARPLRRARQCGRLAGDLGAAGD